MSHRRFCITSYLQFFERQTCPAAASFAHSSHSSFSRRSFFGSSAHAATRMRWNGQIFWLLAFASDNGLTHPSPRLHPRDFGDWLMGSRNPVTAAQLLPNLTGIPRTGPLIKTHKELPPEVAACACSLKIYLSEA